MVKTFNSKKCEEIIVLSMIYRADIHRSGVYVDLEQVFTSNLYIYRVYTRFYFFLSFAEILTRAESGQLGSLGLPIGKCHVMHHYDAS
jgi:hypothetical protein